MFGKLAINCGCNLLWWQSTANLVCCDGGLFKMFANVLCVKSNTMVGRHNISWRKGLLSVKIHLLQQLPLAFMNLHTAHVHSAHVHGRMSVTYMLMQPNVQPYAKHAKPSATGHPKINIRPNTKPIEC